MAEQAETVSYDLIGFMRKYKVEMVLCRNSLWKPSSEIESWGTRSNFWSGGLASIPLHGCLVPL